jgi:hypothetical protein
MKSLGWVALLLTALVGAGSQLAGQAIDARAVVAAPRNSARLGGVTERADGLWAGLAADFRAGPFVLSTRGMRGQLTTSQSGFVPHRDVGELAVGGRYEVRPWIGFAFGYTARAFSSAAGYGRWDLASVGVTASRDVGTPAVRAFASLAYLPVVKIRAQENPTFAFGSDVGIDVAPSRSPFTVSLSYRIERFRFSSATGRSEQFEALSLSAGVRAWRHAGRWRLGGGI